jgi:eukaryotic-like serine/threonine-protein kinase
MLRRRRQADLKRPASVTAVTLRDRLPGSNIGRVSSVKILGGAMNSTLTCLHCGGDLGSDDRFCALCGAESLACASCGQLLLATDHSCPHCGTPAERVVPPDPPGTQSDSPSPWAEMVERLRRATLGEFEIGRELGRGGMAAVFLAHDIALDRKVAIKVMSPALMLGDGMIDRFRHEAVTVASLHHPNIVPVYSVRQAEGLHFFVMRYVEGPSLEEVIQRAGRLPLPIVRSILFQVGAALTHAHRSQVIHRDIKPANILIDADGTAIVTDFGIAKAAERPTRTLSGTLVGTPAYMSPEQCRGVEISGASDQYALGVVAYEMLTGRPPFGGSTLTIMQAHVEQSPAPIAGRCEGCPAEVEAAILRMLAKDPAARWPRLVDATAALGAAPLPEDDPHRAELSRLAAWSGGPSLTDAPTPTSPAPRTRPSSPGEQAGRLVGGISIVPAPAGFEVGDSFLLAAVIRGPHGTRLPPQSVTWGTDTPTVLRVDGAGGMATGLAPGSALLTASCKGIKALLRVEVAEPRADEIVIGPMGEPLHVGDEIRLEATPRDKRGWPISRPVTWESAEPAVAAVTPQGTIVGLATGTVRIAATLDDAHASIVIPVLPPRVAVVDIAAAPGTVSVGESFVLAATPLDRMNAPLSGRTTIWSTSDVSVAVVTGEGWVAALRPGSVVLTATCEGVSASVKVSVLARRVPLPAPPPRRSRRARRTRALSAAAVLAAAVLAGGALWPRLRPAPAADELASVPAATEAPAAPADFPVPDSTAPAAVAITRRPARALRPNATTRLAAEVRDLAGRAVPGADVVWSSSDSTVVWVNRVTGKARGLRPGLARVTAASGERRDSATIAVRPPGEEAPSAASIGIAPRPPLQVGDSALLDAVITGPKGDTLAGAEIAWSSSDSGVVAIEPGTGMVRALSPGTALIVARSGGESAMADLTVVPAAAAGIRILGGRPVGVGETVALSAEVIGAKGAVLSGRPVGWTSSDSGVAAIDPATGLVVARSPGTAEITATSEGKSALVRLSVVPRPEPIAQRGSWAAERGRAEDQVRTGVDECYGALQARDVARLTAIYRPATRSDEEKLKRLSRILRTREWDVAVGERVDGVRRIGLDAATMEFSVPLTWKDSFGGRLTSEPVFRAEFVRGPGGWAMSSCRIVGSPTL